MKKTWKALALGAALLLAACTANTNPNTPEEAVQAFIEAVSSFDAETIVKLSAGYADMTADEQQAALEQARKEAKDVAPIQRDMVKRLLKEVTISEVKVDGDRATVTLKDESDTRDILVKKEKDGTWRVAYGR
ncbi:MAG: DUF4878 domain-containing protein [Bacteroidaceae bacterium]|nr:DUF4878 domain-containing protein [Bacteroidaceae bacterium]